MDPADTTVTDQQLLQRYIESSAQDAFAELVRRHVNWINSMAARLTHDRALADDVTQAVFLLLARKAGSLKQQDILSTWLFTVTRYASSTALRKEIRRKAHERKAAAMRQQTAEASEPAWQEMSPLLDQLVARLREADRQAVLLRFYEQKSFVEIGETLQISEEAARKRVNRSIETLRGMFARRGVTVGAAALAATMSANLAHPASAAVVTAASAAASATAGAASITQGIGFTLALSGMKSVLGVFLILLLLGSGILLLQNGRAQQSAAPSGSSQSSPATMPATDPSPAPLAQARFGRVLTEDDKPVAGARVWQFRWSEKLQRSVPVASAVADADGRFQLPIIGDQASVQAHAPGYGWSGGLIRSSDASDPDEVRLAPPTSMRVRFVDPDGKPAAGIHVKLSYASTSGRRSMAQFPDELDVPDGRRATDAQGACTFDDLPQGGMAALLLSDEQFAQLGYSNRFNLSDSQSTDAGVIHLKRGAKISGTVLFADGKPAPAGISVHAENVAGENLGLATTTDEQGRYSIAQLPAGKYLITLLLSDEMQKSVAAVALEGLQLAAGMHLENQNLTLISGGVVQGKLTEQGTGKPLAGMRVLVQGPSRPRSSHISQAATSDANGIYSLHVPSGAQRVQFFSLPPPPGYLQPNPLYYDVTVADNASAEVNFQIPRGPAAPVSGRAVDSNGHPLAGVEIYIQPRGDSPLGSIATVTDAAGNFSLPAADPNSLLRARKGRWTTLAPVTPVGQVALVLHENVEATLRVTVRQADQSPLAGATVRLMDAKRGGGSYDERTTSADGICTFNRLAPDLSYAIHVSADGFGSSDASAPITPGQQTDLPPIVLPKADSFVSGIVVDENGNPVVDMPIMESSGGYGRMNAARSDIAGRFRVDKLVPGDPITIMAQDENDTRGGSLRDVAPGSDNLVITVQPRTKP